MSEQQYRVIADRTTHPHLVSADAATGDRLVYDVLDHDGDVWKLVRIERPVPTSDMTAMSHETTGFCFCGQMHGQVGNWNEHDWAALRTHAPAGALSVRPSLPTREQIAEAIAKAEDADYWVDEIADWEDREDWEREAHAEDRPNSAYEDRDYYLSTADAVLALLDGADR